MEYLNGNILCLTYDELVPDYMARDNYHYHRKKGNITVHGIGGNGRKVFIEYESLPDNVQTAIKKKVGNPYEYLAKQPILDQIDWDYEAQNFYTNYVLPNGSKLPATDLDAKGNPQINYVERYTKAANWLNMIGRLTSNKRELKQSLNLSVMDFWDTVSELIGKEGIAIPAAPKRLKEKLKQYNAAGDGRYELLIEKHRFGNANASKIADEQSEAVLLKMLCDPRKHDDTVVAAGYNYWAKKNNRPTITPGAVGYFRRKNEHIIAPSRDGLKVAYNRYTKEIERERPSAPLLLINADDNCLDLFFEVEKIKADGGKQKSKHYRPMLYVIIDAYNDYVLGYAVGNSVTHELIYAAFRNALNHIQELTGQYYLPHQLQTDRWGLDVKMKNQLGEFYKRIATFTPQAKHVPQGKYIERSFGVEWHQVLKALPTNNYAGKNITAKERLSAEYIIEASKNYPTIEEMPGIVESFIKVMRLKANPKSGKSRQAEWLEAFLASEKSQKRQIDAGVKIQLIGKKREGAPLTITTKGIQTGSGDNKVRYDVPDEVIWTYNGAKVDLYYDPEKPNEVLATDGKGLRFVTGINEKQPSAIADYKPGNKERLLGLWDAKKLIGEKMANVINDKLQHLGNVDAQSLLQAGVLLKDVKNDAEAEYLASLYGATPKAIEAPNPLIEYPAETTQPKKSIYDKY